MSKFEWWSIPLLICVLCCASNGHDQDFAKKGQLFETNPVELCPETRDKTKCNVRDLKVPRNYWNFVSGWYCYQYTNVNRYIKGKGDYDYVKFLPTICPQISNTVMTLPIRVFNDTNPVTFAFFDYTNSTSRNMLSKIFKNENDFMLYLSCNQVADDCCNKETNETNALPSKEYCPVVFDAWDCFPQTKLHEVAHKVCSPQTKPTCRAYSSKSCDWNAATETAEWKINTSYANCAMAHIYNRRHKFNSITLTISIFLTLPAVVVFLSFSNFRKQTRIILHRNLLIAIVIRSVLTVMSKELILLHQIENDGNGVMDENSVACRVLTFFENVFKNGIYACMLIDGFYLHKVIVRNFAKEPKLWHLMAAVLTLSLVPSLIWATVKGAKNSSNCWLVDTDNEQWIVDGFRIAVLTTNFILLIDIIRIMFTKMKQANTTRQARAAFKATVFLIPLFGLHFIITADQNIVYDDTCVAKDVYEYSRYSLEALQGVMVAILFCYCNNEVHGELKNVYRKLRIHLSERFGRGSFRATKMRRDTTATYVPEVRSSVL